MSQERETRGSVRQDDMPQDTGQRREEMADQERVRRDEMSGQRNVSRDEMSDQERVRRDEMSGQRNVSRDEMSGQRTASRDQMTDRQREMPQQATDTQDAELPRRFDEKPMRLLSEEDNDRLGERWHELQTRFVDDPRQTVAEADRLVADVMQQLSSEFLRARQRLEEQWSRGEEVSTEELRQALQRYRSFFHQLLTF